MELRTRDRKMLTLAALTFAACMVGLILGRAIAGPVEPEPVASPDAAYTEAGGGDPVWGWRACNAREYYGLRGFDLVEWMMDEYDVGRGRADVAVYLSGIHMCPGSVEQDTPNETMI